jgi:hypothetical protein
MAGHDAYSPSEIASLVETRGVAQAGAPAFTTFVLALAAGAFIGLGAVLSTTVATGSSVGYGLTRWLSGVAFSLGLVLVVVAGAELFTGNNLIVMSVVARHVSLGRLLRNWAIVYVGKCARCLLRRRDGDGGRVAAAGRLGGRREVLWRGPAEDLLGQSRFHQVAERVVVRAHLHARAQP